MPVSDADLRRCLSAFREKYLVPKYPNARREEGLLRRAMIDFLLDARPRTVAEFYASVPDWLAEGTSADQLAAELETVLGAFAEFIRLGEAKAAEDASPGRAGQPVH